MVMALTSEVPLDLSNESKPLKARKKRLLMSAIINGTKNKSNVIHSPTEIANVPQQYDKSEPKKRKVKSDSSANPIQRSKYGLRMLPQQVDYYQSILEERRTKMYRESSRPSAVRTVGKPIEKVKPLLIAKHPSKLKDESRFEFVVGDLVWATLPNYKTWFPALIISHVHCKQKPAKKAHIWVYWFGDHQVSEIPKSKIKSFFDNFSEFVRGTSALSSLRMKEALQVLALRAGINFDDDEIPATSNSSTSQIYETALISWAESGFPVKSNDFSRRSFAADPINPIPALVACYLPLDSTFHDAIKADERLQQIVYYDVDKSENAEESIELPEYKQSQIERIKKGEISLSQICIACCCDAESAKGSHSSHLLEHPTFVGGLCRLCYDNIKVTMYAPGEDNKNSFCTVCGQLGKLAICDNINCHRVFCLICIQLYVGSDAHQKVLAMDKWECYLCKSNETSQMGLLKIRVNWRDYIKVLFDPIRSAFKLFDNNHDNSKRPIRVLSLYDGISALKIAMEKVGLTIDAYFASEIDRDSISVAKHHHSENIIYLERVENITIEKIAEICPIDFIVGRYPCNELLNANQKRKGFFENKGSGHLFLYFNHILQLIRTANKGRHVFFLFEIFSSINDTHRDVISDLLNIKPVTLSASDYSVQNFRYLWSNIPGINRPLPSEIQDKLNALLSHMRQKNDLKRSYDLKDDSSLNATDSDSFNPNEVEKLLGFEESYTCVKDLSKNKRQALLRKTWSVELINYIIWSLRDFYTTKMQLNS